MRILRKPLEIVVYQDVLCAWCYLAESRLDTLRVELGDGIRWKTRPYPLRLKDAPPDAREREEWVSEINRAREEPDGGRLTPTLWTQQSPPRSSIPALSALEAARLQGVQAHQLLARAMQRTALEQGIDVTRSDVMFELASHVGLDMNRFAAAFGADQFHRLVLQEHKIAADRGVRGVPTLVIADRWMLCGLRDVKEYRDYILECAAKLESSDVGSPDGVFH
jgi:predicted DsbA family dithiol-disulfide isomerase